MIFISKSLEGLKVQLVEIKIGKGELKKRLDIMEYYRSPVSRQSELLGVGVPTILFWRSKLGYDRRKFFGKRSKKNAK